ncbi:TatD family hydrolase [Patescibacteria group bacterium]|nr:TatD family hydrolase [Patescibacteria group bacterium]MBU1663477.1 TatD family hydrolase [Patescibacteria group bacterium]MBU1933722.1 TatD family hydrolase [Patescibacteria group bacterium]MBU2007668.1 TatD family hydrolase [Patescibacteria group bacterium]MBU2263935.1 TatD family hydrolase [Patescibacteria group bacterium]
MFIDTHAHVNFNTFKNDADEVIRRALANDTWMILVGVEAKTSKRALEYANKYEKGVYVAVGLHPMHTHEQKVEGDDYDFTTREEEFSYDVYEKLAQFKKVVAVGEIGLDYYHIDIKSDMAAAKQKQKEVFLRQLELAKNLKLPVIIHCRQAHDDMLGILKKFRKEHQESMIKNKPWGVMHCFSGDEELAWQYFSLGLNISFTGLITFSAQWDDLIRRLPNDKFMIETDCPYMTPEPHRGKCNEPMFVKYIANRIATIKNINVLKIAEVTTQTARNFFNI